MLETSHTDRTGTIGQRSTHPHHPHPVAHGRSADDVRSRDATYGSAQPQHKSPSSLPHGEQPSLPAHLHEHRPASYTQSACPQVSEQQSRVLASTLISAIAAR